MNDSSGVKRQRAAKPDNLDPIHPMKYSIRDSRTDQILISSIDLQADQIENLSSDNSDGHFQAASLEDLTEAGIDPEQIVFAIVR